jgi:histidinol dehydrogenase
MIRIIDEREAEKLLQRRSASLDKAARVVAPILEDVRKHGDTALRKYARRFDGLTDGRLAVSPAELTTARRAAPKELIRALETATRNVALFARQQLPRETRSRFPAGHQAGQIVRPLGSMGAYIPAGRYPLPSTLVMTAVPARIAGVPSISAACPKPGPVILAAAAYLKVNRVFRIGGAQAIAAFAFGTGTVPKVDRIVGPGNIYVAAAKKLLAGEVGIDFVAGPTEILIIASDGDPRVLAADMLAQAEHDEEAAAILITTSRKLAAAVAREVETQLRDLPTAPTARAAIGRNSAIVVARSRPNHVLPTSGFARVRAGLSASDFVKVISVQELSRASLRRLAPAITTLARAEGLEAHARSVEARFRE